MTMKELKSLKIGDICEIIRGRDAKRICEIAFIEGESVLVRSADGRRFDSMEQYSRLKLTSYRELKLISVKN